MTWVLLSLLSAFTLATSDVFVKLAFRSESDPLVVGFARFGLSIPFVLPLVFLSQGPTDPGAFWFTIALTVPLEITALLLYVTALKKSPMSVTVPFLAFTPAFILVTGWAILGEKPDLGGVVGIALITAGGWLVSHNGERTGLLAPFKNFIHEPGSVMMFAVAALFSVTVALGKKAILLSSPLFLVSTYAMAVTLGLIPVLLIRGRLRKALTSVKKPVLWGVGFFWGLMGLFHVFGILLAPAAHMVAVKRSSFLFGVLYGIFLFHEGGALYRIPGAILMVAGVLVLGFLPG